MVFSPLTCMPLLLFMTIFNAGLNQQDTIKSLLIIFFLGFIPSVGFWIYLKLTKRISDWGISHREQRIQLGLFILFTALILTAIFFLLKFYTIVSLLTVILCGGIFFMLITKFWKISAHTTSVMLGWAFFIYLYGNQYYWTLIIPLAVGWARIYRKNHTPVQSLAGMLLALLIFLIYKFFINNYQSSIIN